MTIKKLIKAASLATILIAFGLPVWATGQQAAEPEPTTPAKHSKVKVKESANNVSNPDRTASRRVSPEDATATRNKALRSATEALATPLPSLRPKPRERVSQAPEPPPNPPGDSPGLPKTTRPTPIASPTVAPKPTPPQ